MRKLLFTMIVVSSLTTPANAKDSCASLLCMAGMLQGQGGSNECSGPISDYFSILKFGKHGKFNAGATASARLDFLNQCPAQDMGDWTSQINATYGTVYSL